MQNIERPETQTKRLNLISVQNKIELPSLANFLKSKKKIYKNFNIK